MARKWNDPDLRQTTRMISDEECTFGVACYRGKVNATGDSWDSTLVGNDGDYAEEWLRTGDDSLLRMRADENGSFVQDEEAAGG